MTLALFRRRRPAPAPPPMPRPPDPPPPVAPRCAVPAVPHEPPADPGAAGYVVVVTAPGGRATLTHASLMSLPEAHAEARHWRRGPGARSGLTYEVRPVGGQR